MKSIEQQNLDFSDKEFSAKIDIKIMNMRETKTISVVLRSDFERG